MAVALRNQKSNMPQMNNTIYKPFVSDNEITSVNKIKFVFFHIHNLSHLYVT